MSDHQRFNTLDFALETNGPGWPNPPWSTFLLRKLFENQNYRDRFVNIYCDRLNTVFKPSFLNERIGDMSSYIEDIIPVHQERWPWSAQDWGYHIEILENFSNNPFLESFYKNIKHYALPTQLFFLLQRSNEFTNEKYNEIFNNKYSSKPVKLSGELYLPKKKGKFPVVYIQHGTSNPKSLINFFQKV